MVFYTGNKDVDKEDASGSFFDFLSPTAVPAEGDEEELREREFLLWIDFELAEQFQKELVPRAVEWYTGDARSEDEDWDEDENNEQDEDREGNEDSEDDSVEVSEDDSEYEEDAENSDDSSRQLRQRRQLQMPQRRR